MPWRNRPALWVALWDVNTIRGPETKEFNLFTVATTKEEAIAIMSEGILAFPEVEGAVLPPREIAKRNLESLPGNRRAFFDLLLAEERFRFIVPYNRLRAEMVVDLVMRMMEE